MHETFVTKQELSKSDVNIIKSLVELMCESYGFDMDMEYMLVDLLLKSKLVKFDEKEFSASASRFLQEANYDDLLNFGSVLYILLKENYILRKGKLKGVCMDYVDKIRKIDVENKNLAENVANSLIYLVK